MRENLRTDLPELGARIRQARMDRKMSQMDLAEACGISVPYVSDIERGKKCFSVDILLRIALALQASTDWLLRLDVPQTEYTHHAEASKILSDCSEEETLLLLELLQNNKNALRKRKNSI